MGRGAVASTPFSNSSRTDPAMPAIDPPVSRAVARTRFDDAAIERLESLLFDECLPQGGLSLEAVDGLFSGARVSPGEPLELDELLPLVLGRDAVDPEAAAPDVAAASEELLRLLELMWESIGQRIARGPTDDPSLCMPLLGLPPTGEDEPLDEQAMLEALASDEGDGDHFPVGASWAVGFMLAYDLRASDWEKRLDEDEEGALDVVDILSLIPEIDLDDASGSDGADITPGAGPQIELPHADGLFEQDPEAGPDAPISLEARLDIIASLPSILHEFHGIGIDERTSHVPVRREQEPGRNDPCPCGSGQKYKKCHGDPSRLH